MEYEHGCPELGTPAGLCALTMLSFFRKKPNSRPRRRVGLCEGGFCAVVGESYYQDALRATSEVCWSGPEGRMFTATLVAEPENPHDANAIAIHSSLESSATSRGRMQLHIVLSSRS